MLTFFIGYMCGIFTIVGIIALGYQLLFGDL